MSSWGRRHPADRHERPGPRLGRSASRRSGRAWGRAGSSPTSAAAPPARSSWSSRRTPPAMLPVISYKVGGDVAGAVERQVQRGGRAGRGQAGVVRQADGGGLLARAARRHDPGAVRRREQAAPAALQAGRAPGRSAAQRVAARPAGRPPSPRTRPTSSSGSGTGSGSTPTSPGPWSPGDIKPADRIPALAEVRGVPRASTAPGCR